MPWGKFSLQYCHATCTNNVYSNKIEGTQKKKKLTSSELRKKKKERMARRKRGEEVRRLILLYDLTHVLTHVTGLQ